MKVEDFPLFFPHSSWRLQINAVFVRVIENLEGHKMYELIPQTWEVLEFTCWSWKVRENVSYVL